MSKKLSEGDVADIVQKYAELKSAYEVERQCGIPRTTVYAVLKRLDIPRTAYAPVRRNNVTNVEIVEAYKRLGTGKKVSAELGVSEKLIYDALREQGIKTDGHSRYLERIKRFSDQDVQEIKKLYLAGNSATSISKKYKCAIYTVMKALGSVGINAHSRPRMTDEEKDRARQLYESGMTFKAVGKEIGVAEATITRLIHKNHPEIVRSRYKRGEESAMWKGGRSVHHGYAYIRLSADDEMACMRSKNGQVAENRLVMARSLGRPLEDHETVHHKNGDKVDNRLENLQLRNGRHGKGAHFVCLDCGSHNIKGIDV